MFEEFLEVLHHEALPKGTHYSWLHDGLQDGLQDENLVHLQEQIFNALGSLFP